MRSLRPGNRLHGKTHRSGPVSIRYHCFVTQSVTRRRPELVAQTLAAVNVRWWSFSPGGSARQAKASLLAGARCAIICVVPETSVVQAGVVGCPSVVRAQRRWSLECERWRPFNCDRLCFCDALSEATWRESSSIRSSSVTLLSVVEGVMLSLIGRGVTSQILSVRWEA